VKRRAFTFGFTLIELMIVMTVVVFIFGGSIAAFLKFNSTQSLLNDARQVSSELNRARTMAASQQYPTGCISLKGVSVTSDVNMTGMTVTTRCGSGNFPGEVNKILTSSIFISSVDITFLPGSGYVSDGADKEIKIQDGSSPPAIKTVVVGTYGLISIL